MNIDEWKNFVTHNLNERAPDRDAMKRWVETQGFTVDSQGDSPTGGLWFSAESKRMTFAKLTVRWDDKNTPPLSVEVS
jgi:hypothetical protein